MSSPIDLELLTPPSGFMAVLETLESAGYEAWAVGGALRDALERASVGVPAPLDGGADWDVATDARPEQVIALFPRTIPLGVEHGTVGVLPGDGSVYETTTFRLDIETDGRHATVAFADSIDDDLSRRDFTINAMAWRPRTGEFHDPFHGAADLESGVLRAVGEPAARFAEDYLRVLRGLRFAGQFDLEIEPATRTAMVAAASQLSRLSAERVREELMKVLASRVPSTALDLYADCGALDPWFPEIGGLAQDRAGWRQHLGTVDAVSRERPLVRLARLLAPMSQDADRRAELADALLERLRFSNSDRKTVTRLVRGYLPFPSPLDSAAQLRSWLADTGDSWRDLFRLHVAGARASGDEQWKRVVAASFRSIHAEVLEHPPTRLADLEISGDDLLSLGVPSGPIIGLLLEELLEQVLEDPDRNERDTLKNEAERLIEIGALTGPRPRESTDADG
jgi:tRNA nucleotidyltransferase (CCA-adding enzyme)